MLERGNSRGANDPNATRYFVRQRKLKRIRRGVIPAPPPQQTFFHDKWDPNPYRLPDPTPVSLRVRCNGRLHRITAVPGGAVAFHDHTRQELRALRSLRDLGDTTCGCLDFVTKLPDRERWPKAQRTLRFAQGTRETRRKKMPLAYRPSTKPFTPDAPENRIRQRWSLIVQSLGHWANPPKSLGEHWKGIKSVSVGIADADHPPGIIIGGRLPTFAPYSGGWRHEQQDLEAVVAVPLSFTLRIADKTGAVEHFIVFAWRGNGPDRAFATVAVRKSAMSFALEEHEVERAAGRWKFVHGVPKAFGGQS